MQPDLHVNLTRALQHVEGWLSLDEAWALHETARQVHGSDPIMIVEIGSWKGRSTIALALGIRARGEGIVFAVDPHTGAPEGITEGWSGVHIPGGLPVTAQEFHWNIAAADVAPFVRSLITTSHEARAQFANKTVDILFVDGSHEYEDVKADITDWQPTLKDGAVVAFNDPSVPGVYRALRELVVRPGTPYRQPALVQNTLFFEFQPTRPWTSEDAISLRRLVAVFELRFQANRLRRFMPTWFVRLGHSLSRWMVGG
jgi:hypothetical protein